MIALPVEIDVTNSRQVHDALARFLCGGAVVLIADASATTFCDCAGVGALTRAHNLAAAAGSQLRVVISPAVRRILELSWTQHLDSYPTVAAALDSEQRPATSTSPAA